MSELIAPTPLPKEAIVMIAINAGIPADVARRLLDGGEVVLRDDGRVKVTLSVSVSPTQPKRLGILGCSDSYCDGPAGHPGQHYQWVPE